MSGRGGYEPPGVELNTYPGKTIPVPATKHPGKQGRNIGCARLLLINH